MEVNQFMSVKHERVSQMLLYISAFFIGYFKTEIFIDT